jgi:hypothetical protein
MCVPPPRRLAVIKHRFLSNSQLPTNQKFPEFRQDGSLNCCKLSHVAHTRAHTWTSSREINTMAGYPDKRPTVSNRDVESEPDVESTAPGQE